MARAPVDARNVAARTGDTVMPRFVCPLSKRLSGASIITTAYSEQGKELRYLYKDFGFWVSPD